MILSNLNNLQSSNWFQDLAITKLGILGAAAHNDIHAVWQGQYNDQYGQEMYLSYWLYKKVILKF